MASEGSDLQAATENYDFVRFSFADINGIARSKTICKPAFKNCFENGGPGFWIGIIGYGLRGELGPTQNAYKDHPEINPFTNGNISATPVPGTLHPLPYAGAGKYRVGEVLCETFFSFNGSRQEECPRFIARKQLDDLERRGFQLFSSFEMEFVLLDASTKVPASQDLGDFFISIGSTAFEGVILEIADMLGKMGVEVESLQAEAGLGQFELVFIPQIGIKMADNVLLTKDCIKAVARKHGFMAVFMTRPLEFSLSNGMHFNHSIRHLSSGNAFSDRSRKDLLSKDFRHWMGGLVHHFPALTALCSQTVNCYRRLHLPWAPTNSSWGIEDRLSSFRVKAESPSATYIESRLPSGCANPYIVMAATVAAGLDGLEREIAPPLPTTGVPDEDRGLYTNVEPTDAPMSMEEGLKSVRNDAVLQNAFGQIFLDWFAAMKQDELAYISKTVDEKVVGKDRLSLERDMYMKLM